MSPTPGDRGFEGMPSSSAVRITIDGDPAIVIVIDTATTAPGSSSAAGLEPPAGPRVPGLTASTDPARAAAGPADPAADRPPPGPTGGRPGASPESDGAPDPSPGPETAPGASPESDGAPVPSPGRPLIRAIPASHDQASGTERLEIVVDGWRFEAVVEPARRAMLRDLARRERGTGGEGPRMVRAPLPGRIVRVWVTAGDVVEPGAPLCSLEAMKMENEIRAARAGTIERVSVAAGAHVEYGDELVVIG